MMKSSDRPDLSHIRTELKHLVLDAFGPEALTMPDDVPILDLGVSSLALVEGMRRVFEHFGVLLSIRRVIEGQVTLGGLALYIEQELGAQKTVKSISSEKAAADWVVQRSVPLDYSQQHIAFLSRYSNEAASAYNESLIVRLEGDLHGPAIQAALEEAANRFEALRTALSPDEDLLTVGTGQSLEVQVSSVTAGNLSTRLSEIVSRAFEPGKRLFRAELLRLSDKEHLLVLVGYALVLDQQGLGQVLNEIASLYRAFDRDETACPAAPCLQWTDYLAIGTTTEAGIAHQQAQTYWVNQFMNGVPRLELPTDFPRPAVKNYAGARLAVNLDADLQDSLPRWAAAQGISLESLLFAACALYLQRLTGVEDLVIGVESEALYRETGLPVVASTRTMLPVRVAINPDRSFAEFVRAQHCFLQEANTHKAISFTELIQSLQLPRDQSRSPIFTVAFRARNLPSCPDFTGVRATCLLPPSAGARFDVEFIAQAGEGRLQLVCDYSRELFKEATIARWLQNIQALLLAVSQDGQQLCGVLNILSPAEHDLLHRWNETTLPLPDQQNILQVILEQAEQRPGQPALRFGEETLTYTQMVARMDAITAALLAAGVSQGQRIGVLLRRSLDLVPALLAVWRAGAILVPLDSTFPKQRLAFMIADAEVQIVLTSGELLPIPGEDYPARVICVETIHLRPVSKNGWCPTSAPEIAQIMFTSGSTGKPKGVEVRHRALLNILLELRTLLAVGPDSHLLALTTPSFDISTVELYMPLMAGGLVEVGEDGLAADGLQLGERLRTCRPSHLQATPSTFKSLLAAGWEGDNRLCLASAGEAIGRELAEELLPRCNRLFNLYGPTETTVYSTTCQVRHAPDRPIRIGRPIANTRMYILDSHLQPLPIGAIGELYIGGEGVSPGYWNRPEQTAERFISDPFLPGERIYRTGDLARYLPDGDLICLGRIDDQVKIHGVRIELGEVESALRILPGVRDAVVTSWRDTRGDLQLVAHVIPLRADGLTAGEIRAHLRERLPEVMVPPYILFSSAFPLTANGKIQRAALPAPDVGLPPGLARKFEPPVSVTERSLAEAWGTVLGIDIRQIGRQADFMELGGHSLLMTHLMLEVRKRFQVTFKMREFFGASTLQQFAALIDDRRQQTINAELRQPALPRRSAEWARQRMAFLAREAELPLYISPPRSLSYHPGEMINTVFLTGATGFLGAYIIAEILQTTQATIFCLVRPRRGENGKQRIEKQMRHYAVWPQNETWQQAWNTRLHVVEGDVTLPRMGLPDATYEKLARQVDAIFNGAAHVNFIYPYEALRATNVLGLHEIVQFAFHTRIKPVHHLSTAAIWPMGAQYTFRERDPIDHYQPLNLGYDEAKWVGEKTLLNAAERGLPVARYRPGEVGGDSITGRCVTDHFLIASIKGFLQFGAFPQLDIEVDVVPVDYVAKAMVYLAFNRQPLGRAFHLTNPTRRTMQQALTFLRGLGYQFIELPFEELRDRLLNSPNFAGNALFAYQAALEDMDDMSMQLPTYDTREAQRELQGSGIVCAPADEKLFQTYFDYLRGCGFMPAPDLSAVREGIHA